MADQDGPNPEDPSGSASESPDVEAGTTDDENELEDLATPLWQQFEDQVTQLMNSLGNGHADHNVKLVGEVSGTLRQIDALVSGDFGGKRMRVAVECKRYKRKLGIGKIDEFVGKLHDLRVDAGVLFCVEGYTKQAKARAEKANRPQITLYTLAVEPTNWADELDHLAGLASCPNEDCYGSLAWEPFPQESGEVIEAGQCFSCGTWTVRCPTCEWETTFWTNEVDCEGICNRRFAMTSAYPGDGEVTVVALEPNEDQ